MLVLQQIGSLAYWAVCYRANEYQWLWSMIQLASIRECLLQQRILFLTIVKEPNNACFETDRFPSLLGCCYRAHEYQWLWSLIQLGSIRECLLDQRILFLMIVKEPNNACFETDRFPSLLDCCYRAHEYQWLWSMIQLASIRECLLQQRRLFLMIVKKPNNVCFETDRFPSLLGCCYRAHEYQWLWSLIQLASISSS